MNKLRLGFLLVLVILLLTGCSQPPKKDESSVEDIKTALCDGDYILNVKEETIEMEGLKNEYTFLYIADLHIIIPSEDVAESDKETVDARYHTWAMNANGQKSKDIYSYLIEKANSVNIDAVLMGGDMMDFLSESNWNHMKDGLEKLNKPYLYATADHDSQTYYTSYNKKEKKQLQNAMSQGLTDTLEYDEFVILSINESTSQLTEDALNEINEVIQIGKPIILVTHVPFDSSIDKGLGEKSMEVWNDRKLLWGQGCTYQPDETTQKFIDIINAENSPIAAVLAGHVHYEYICMINENIKQYVFNPAYSGEVVLFTIKGTP